MKDKKKSRLSPAKKAAVIILSILIAIVSLLLVIRIGEKIAFIPFYANAKAEFTTPGMSSGFVGQGQITIGEEQIPLKYLDSSALVKDVTTPPMSEEIVYKDGRIYIMTESASNKYIFGKFMSGIEIYSYKV